MNIISHIRESGKTVSEVCQEAGITRAAFYKAIKPEGNPQLETLLAISRATGLSPVQIKPRLASDTPQAGVNLTVNKRGAA